jgi:uncharacterized protein YukE
MQKYIQTINKSNNKSNNRSYADALKQPRQIRQPFKQTPKPTYQNPITQFTSKNEPSISDIMKALNQIGEELKNIRVDLNKMDDRIGCLEEDAYEYHTFSERDEQMRDDISENIQRPSTPPRQTQQSQTGLFDYQRKRPALSPAQEIRAEQRSLHDNLNNMQNILTDIGSNFTILTRNTPDTNEEEETENTNNLSDQ